jgi:hypothetical protein
VQERLTADEPEPSDVVDGRQGREILDEDL